MNDSRLDHLPIWKAYERATQGRWISSVYRMAGNNAPLTKRQKAAREPGPCKITRPALDAKLGQLLQQVRS
jgi:hypothetical protein